MTAIFRDPETGTHALTDAQVRALNVLAEWGSARVSNRTATATGVISAHTARTLHAETLATPPNRYPGGALVELTPAGKRACRHLGIRVGA